MMFYPGFDNGSSEITYSYAYMAMNTYWFCSWDTLGFYQEDFNTLPKSPQRDRYYVLIPGGLEAFCDIQYTITHDPGKFWK